MTLHRDDALVSLVRTLDARGYRFVTPTPATHARVVARPDRARARDLADVLGWSLPFAADAILAELAECPQRWGAQVVDIGTGAGVGAIVTAARCPDTRVAMTDVNPQALRLARINARAAGIEVNAVLGDTLAGIAGPIDVALANPPFIVDAAGRFYRHGGDMHGAAVALAMAGMAVPRLAPAGRFLLYTGSAIVRGADRLRGALATLAAAHGCTLRYRETDPDVFGEELESPAYAEVDRIALVVAVITRP